MSELSLARRDAVVVVVVGERMSSKVGGGTDAKIRPSSPSPGKQISSSSIL
jgi:hypothetical protein